MLLKLPKRKSSELLENVPRVLRAAAQYSDFLTITERWTIIEWLLSSSRRTSAGSPKWCWRLPYVKIEAKGAESIDLLLLCCSNGNDDSTVCGIDSSHVTAK